MGKPCVLQTMGLQKFGLTEPLKLYSIPVQGTYGCSKDCLCDYQSIRTVTDQLPHCPNSLKCFSPVPNGCLNVGSHPSFSSPPGAVLFTLLFSPRLLLSYRVCMVLYILFWWSGTPVHSQLVFYIHLCV